MESWLFSIIFLVLLTTTQAERFSFSQNKDLLRNCIEYHLSKDTKLKIDLEAKSIAEILSNKIHGKSYEKRSFYTTTNSVYYTIRNQNSSLFSNNEVPKELRDAIRHAARNCVDRKNLPRFVHEPRELAEFLDFILVDWPTPLNEMISTHEGRSTLRLYAYSAGMRLMSALKYFLMDLDVFHSELLNIWLQRVQKFYDFSEDEIPYIRHRFTTDTDRMFSSTPLDDVHTMDDMIQSTNCRKLNKISNVEDQFTSSQVDTAFSENPGNANYLDVHLDQCYGIIFFFLELQLRGINTDEDDIYNGPIPNNIVLFSKQKIVWNNVAYKSFLMSWHEYFRRFPSVDFEGCFSKGTKEDLIIQISLLIVKKTTFTTSTTTTTTMTRSTEYPDEGSKKGGFRARDCGKYLLPSNSFKATFSDQEQNDQTDNNSFFGFYGYIMSNVANATSSEQMI